MNEDLVIISLLVFSLGIIFIPLTLGVRKELAKEKIISNSEFTNGHESVLNYEDNKIKLVSSNYPDPAGQVWVVSDTALTIINRETNKTILFSTIPSMTLNFKADTGTLACIKLVENQISATVRIEPRDIARITFSIKDREIAQAIHDRVLENVK